MYVGVYRTGYTSGSLDMGEPMLHQPVDLLQKRGCAILIFGSQCSHGRQSVDKRACWNAIVQQVLDIVLDVRISGSKIVYLVHVVQLGRA